MNQIRGKSNFISKYRLILALGALMLVLAAILFMLFGREGLQSLMAAKDRICDWCEMHPSYLFLALVILPALGFPASPLMILAGIVWGSNLRTCSS